MNFLLLQTLAGADVNVINKLLAAGPFHFGVYAGLKDGGEGQGSSLCWDLNIGRARRQREPFGVGRKLGRGLGHGLCKYSKYPETGTHKPSTLNPKPQ